jgi:iron(III) transport system ATP-binding protein
MSVLSIRGLGKRFGATQALADFNLDVLKGSRTAVVGPSGSGKTTLLRLIAGFEVPDTGEITLDGQPIANATSAVPAHRRNIGLVMQEGALFPHLSVIENIRFGMNGNGGGETEALRLMDLVELERSMATRQPHQLSGGQQQRVALARALARQPRVMLLDEPFSALDTGLREQLRSATSKILAEAGIATVLVTHDQYEAMSFADQLVVLRGGRLMQAGNPRDLYLAPADATTAAFLGTALILDATLGGGIAHSALGDIPLSPAQQSAAGPARILLRPEQLHLSSQGGADAWTVESIALAGPVAHVAIRHPSVPGPLTFETTQQDLPPAGSTARVDVHGAAWAFL